MADNWLQTALLIHFLPMLDEHADYHHTNVVISLHMVCTAKDGSMLSVIDISPRHVPYYGMSIRTMLCCLACRGVRTADSTPPIIHSLTTTTSTSGNTFLITLNASKPGILYYVATSAGQASPARIDQLLRPRPTHGFNLSGSMAVASDSNIAQTTLCVADGRSLQLWAVLQDLEGSFPGRVPNNSTMVRCAIITIVTSQAASELSLLP